MNNGFAIRPLSPLGYSPVVQSIGARMDNPLRDIQNLVDFVSLFSIRSKSFYYSHPWHGGLLGIGVPE